MLECLDHFFCSKSLIGLPRPKTNKRFPQTNNVFDVDLTTGETERKNNYHVSSYKVSSKDLLHPLSSSIILIQLQKAYDQWK